MSDFILGRLKIIIDRNCKLILLIILLLNFALRLLIYCKTILLNFSDYQAYLAVVDRIHNEGNIPILGGNFLFTISYIGYFAKYVLGSIDNFFYFNCLLGTLTTFLIALLIIRLTGKAFSGVITAIILTFYTEFMVFSSVFYTPVIMLFLLALFTISLYYYYSTTSKTILYSFSAIILIVFIATFLFKPELVFLPIFLLVFMVFFIRRRKVFFLRSLLLVLVLTAGIVLIKASGIYYKPEGDTIANDFIFFGHTDYGGDGGEGSFILPGNKIRYEEAWTIYCKQHGITGPTVKDRNRFQLLEIKKFIIHHPLKWVGLQFTKFFRTFGVVPETTSFKVLYTGLFKGSLWLTSIIVVAPVALIILMFILFFNFSAILQLTKGATAQGRNGTVAQRYNGSPLPTHRSPFNSHHSSTDHRLPITDYKKHFFYIYCLLFFYYLIASIFFGQYQERYRMPLMVVFIIPALGYFIASFNKEQFLKKSSLIIKSVIIVLFLTVWVFQAKKAISNKERLENAIESVIGNR
ncbi:MAG: hypothetical protein NTV31_04505 [Bacteroidia bacterium]|nr:hypothetical protein [Bacteroidia bacterium]